MEFSVYVITASDAGSRGERVDESGPAIEATLTENGYKIAGYKLLPDDRKTLADAMKKVCLDGEADLILTTGGTGLSPRDVTPEATKDIIERDVPGISEAIRADSMQYTNRAMLSRGTAGILKNTLIINLPGSPKAVQECLEFLLPVLDHALAILTGQEHNCAR